MGVYIAQTYEVPNVKALFDMSLNKARHLEEDYRKPEQKDPNHRKPEKHEE